jgi:hypothetical protein
MQIVHNCAKPNARETLLGWSYQVANSKDIYGLKQTLNNE